MVERTGNTNSAGAKSLASRLLGVFGRESKQPVHINAKGARLDTTKVSQSLDQVTATLRADGVKRLLVQGDRDFFAAAKAALPGLAMQWSSPAYREVLEGALNPEGVDYDTIDAVLCGGRDAATCFRHAVTRLAEADATKPVHWVGADWEFCAGTLPAPAGISGGEVLIFNHFQHFFGIKDPLQFRVEILRGADRQYFYRILQPNESLLLRLDDYLGDGSQPVCVLVHVSHPILTRGRHFRFRVCADLHWRDSFTTLHSAHEFLISPDYKFEFRLPRGSLRDGEVALIVPNYSRDMGADHEVKTSADGEPRLTALRKSEFYLEEVRTPLAESAGNRTIGWTYRGYGGSFWFALENESSLSGGHRGSLVANHHQSVPIADRPRAVADESELDWYRQMEQAGFMVKPHALPLSESTAPFRFGFEFDGANPPFDQFQVRYFDAAGGLLGTAPYRKTLPGPVFGDALLEAWQDPARDKARLAIITPDWVGGRLRHKSLKKMSNLFVEMRATGDRDVTEFQDCWRNCGVMVDGLPHFTGLPATVFGRSNLFARARCDAGYRSAIVAIYGGGWLGHRGTAHIEVTVRNIAGKPVTATAEVAAFCWRTLWLDELFPELAQHLAPDGFGSLLVQSQDGDLNCVLVTTSSQGAIGLQHMWGY